MSSTVIRSSTTGASLSQRAYQGAWRGISEQLRAETPYCAFCHAEAGEIYVDGHGRERTVTLSVDHIDADTQNNQPSNLRVLCLACHGSLTGDGWRR